MKGLRIVLVSFIFVFSIVAFATSSTVEASQELGELCWEVLENDVVSGTLKLGILLYGDNHYIVNGKALDTAGNTIEILQGIAEIEGEEIWITINSSGRHDGALYTSTSNIILNKSAIDGTILGIDTFAYYGDGTVHNKPFSHILRLITCPFIREARPGG